MTRIPDKRAVWLARNALPHEPALRSWLLGKRVRDIDDIVQETYAILARLESVDAIRDPKSYMFQTAHSVVLSQFRRARIVSIIAIDDMGRFADGDDAPSPETQVSDRQELQRLADAIGALPPRCREVFVLRKIHGMPQRGVAQKLGISEGTAEKHMCKALQILVAALGRGRNAPRRTSKGEKARARNQDS